MAGRDRVERWLPTLALLLLASALLAACGWVGRVATPGSGDELPSKEPAATMEEWTASASGPLAVACPTLAAAKAAVPDIEAGPDINTTPFKTMVLQCGYTLRGLDAGLRQAGIGILVFDTSEQGVGIWDSVRTDSSFTDPTDLPALADVAQVAFRTGAPGRQDVWVVQGPHAFHMSTIRRDGVPFDQMTALARLMLEGLARIGR